ncbi:TPR-like protein [Phlegmacium glaucopus]|nr:TPR-like protein [Phlegmacium glaucopus]
MYTVTRFIISLTTSEAQPTAWTFSSPPSSYPPSPISEPEDVLQAEKEKEKGYLAFKTAKYAEAVALYSKAIELNPSEPSYLTDRAASHMALKRFRPALEDCQLAASLQSAAPSSHTLTRLARCQLAVGLSTSTLSSIHKVLALDPRNAEAILLRDKVQILESHLRNFEDAKVNKDWTLVLLALGKCLSAIECEGTDIPVDWTRRRVELELTRGDWEAANTVAKDAVRLNSNPPDLLTLHGLVLFLMGRLSQALQHATLALRLDPSYEPAMKLRNRVKEVEKLKEEGNATLKNGNLKEAYEKYSECLEHVGESDEEGKGGPIRAILLSKRAGMLLKLERYQDALLDADASLKLYPTFGTLRTRAHIHLHLDNFDSSIADFNSAIQQAQMQGFTTENDTHALRSELKKAESALKRGKTKDYYKILGISRDCSEKAIWKGYRQENLKHHPDNGGSEEKFKLVFEAYAVLSDPYRREMYDLGEDEDGMNVGSSRMSVGFGEMHPSDLPRTYFGGVRSTVQSTMDEKCVTVGSPLSSHQLQEDVVIAIMGPTGSGKSSFINKVNNQAKDKLEVGSTFSSNHLIDTFLAFVHQDVFN